jgi:hypothetical protein
MAHDDTKIAEFSACEKIWLLAGEVLRDEGVETVTSHHLATVLGQALACVAIHETIDPLDRRTMMHILERAGTVATRLHGDFVEQCRNV